jgi:hypothetical protein
MWRLRWLRRLWRLRHLFQLRLWGLRRVCRLRARLWHWAAATPSAAAPADVRLPAAAPAAGEAASAAAAAATQRRTHRGACHQGRTSADLGARNFSATVGSNAAARRTVAIHAAAVATTGGRPDPSGGRTAVEDAKGDPGLIASAGPSMPPGARRFSADGATSTVRSVQTAPGSGVRRSRRHRRLIRLRNGVRGR